MTSHLTRNQIELLRQAAGQLGRPDYGSPSLIARDMEMLIRLGLIERAMEDDQPTAYATSLGEAELAALHPETPNGGDNG